MESPDDGLTISAYGAYAEPPPPDLDEPSAKGYAERQGKPGPKTGTGLPMMTRAPYFIDELEPYEPIAVPRETMLEECIRRETERIAHQDSL